MAQSLSKSALALGLLALCHSTSMMAQESRCTKSDALSRTLALVYPDALDQPLAACLQNEFQAYLDLEKKMDGKGTVDDYAAEKVAIESSAIGSDIYTQKNSVDLKAYRQGAEIYGAHRRLIRGAKEEVLLQTYFWESESYAAKEIFAGLQELAANRSAQCNATGELCSPLPITMIVNYGPAKIINFFAKFNPLDALNSTESLKQGLAALAIDKAVLDIRVVEYRHEALGMMHVKNLIVDGQVAMITGANVQRYNDPGIDWYDTGYIVAGDVVKGLRKDFINNLIRSKLGKEKDGDLSLALTYGTAFGKVFKTKLDSRAFMEQPYDNAGQDIPIVIISRNAVGGLSSSNNSSQNRGFQAAFYAAKSKIRIQTPNLNDDAAIRGVAQALNRYVDVDLVLSRRFNCNTESLPGQGGDNSEGVKRLLDQTYLGSPQSQNLDARWFAVEQNGSPFVPSDNSSAKDPKDRALNSHAKYMSVDGAFTIVGSTNHDTQSWNHSREQNLMIFDSTVTAAWDSQIFVPNHTLAQGIQTSELKKTWFNCKP